MSEGKFDPALHIRKLKGKGGEADYLEGSDA